MIPWDEISEDMEDAEEVERWRELVSDKTLAVALGVTDEFVLLSLANRPTIWKLSVRAERSASSLPLCGSTSMPTSAWLQSAT